MTEYQHKEWINKITAKFGISPLYWKFKCPGCGKISSGKEFKELGGTPEDLIQKCIGNFKDCGKPDPKNNENGCNWKAYGLFRGPDVVIDENGEKCYVFPIAEE